MTAKITADQIGKQHLEMVTENLVIFENNAVNSIEGVRFQRCVFYGTGVINVSFSECTFYNCRFEIGFHKPASNVELTPFLQFHKCNFDSLKFENCEADVMFSSCDAQDSVQIISFLRSTINTLTVQQSNVTLDFWFTNFKYAVLNWSNIRFRTWTNSIAGTISSGFSGLHLHSAEMTGNLFSMNRCVVDGTLRNALINMTLVMNAGCEFKGKAIGYNICPTDSFIIYKLVKRKRDNRKMVIALEVPKDALRSNAFARKIRVSKAKVIGVVAYPGAGLTKTRALYVSYYDSKFVYQPGAMMEPTKPFNPDWYVECDSGIHGYLSPEEAWLN